MILCHPASHLAGSEELVVVLKQDMGLASSHRFPGSRSQGSASSVNPVLDGF